MFQNKTAEKDLTCNNVFQCSASKPVVFTIFHLPPLHPVLSLQEEFLFSNQVLPKRKNFEQ